MKKITVTTPEGSVTSINVCIDGKEVYLSLETANTLYNELHKLFGYKQAPYGNPNFPMSSSATWYTSTVSE